jgi:hypothetical protein
MLSLVTPDAVASMVTLQIGVGTLPPAGKSIVRVSVVPESVADNDPSLTLWHDAQEPSEGLVGRVAADPDSAAPT